jgi:hypothetical protein
MRSVPFSEPTYEGAKGVFQLAEPSLRRPDDDEPFIHAVREEFPTLMARQVLPPEASFGVPYLAMNSSTGSSRLAVSAQGAEFDVRFYDEFSTDRERCFEYLRRKLKAAMDGWEALGLKPAFFGLVVTVNFSFEGEPDGAVEHLVSRHTKYEVPRERLQEAQIRVSFKVDGQHFLTLNLANYESKEVERAVFPGLRMMQVKPWEGEVTDRGIQLSVDVNNRLAAIERREDPVVDAGEVEAMVSLHERVLSHSAKPFVESGTVNLDDVVREGA